ncbi:MAG: hypothetical protein H7A35_03270 [Planctomycetales bacterium]|nr:hypothetical protein [bacterium]UNM09075.1 MAG: hypothetical protein H7A35_03270 [Planctomycetales bacterium]
MKRVPLFELLLLACLILLPQSAYADALNDEQVAIAAERNGDKDSALKLYQSAFDGYSDDEQFAEAARVAQSLMLLQISLGMIGEAVDSSARARHMLVQAGRSSQAAQLANQLASLLKARSEYKLAEESYLAALDIYTQDGNRVSMAGTLMSLGVLAELQEQPLRSAEYYEQAGDVFLALSDERGLMHSYGSAGNARLAASDDVGAEQAFRQALFLCEKLDDPLVCVDLELGLSAALRGMERLKEALDSTDSCLGMLAQSPDRFLQARTMLERGRILGLQDDRAAALDAMVQAWELFGKDGRMEQQAAMATELIEAAQQAGRNDLVQRYRQLRSELNVSS